MSLDNHLHGTLEQLLSPRSADLITASQLIHCIDLTLLDDNASLEALALLADQAKTNHVAAVCVFSKHLNEFKSISHINLATVINFPLGNENITTSLSEIHNAVALGANEIDYVLSYQEYLAGNQQEALAKCHRVAELCKNLKVTLKIILETGAFPDALSIYQVSQELIKTDCNFLKTSTGKIAQGACLSAVFAMLSAIKESGMPCGIKVSGGVRTPSQAFNYACLAELMIGKRIDSNWFRIGASGLLDELLNQAKSLSITNQASY